MFRNFTGREIERISEIEDSSSAHVILECTPNSCEEKRVYSLLAILSLRFGKCSSKHIFYAFFARVKYTLLDTARDVAIDVFYTMREMHHFRVDFNRKKRIYSTIPRSHVRSVGERWSADRRSILIFSRALVDTRKLLHWVKAWVAWWDNPDTCLHEIAPGTITSHDPHFSIENNDIATAHGDVINVRFERARYDYARSQL